VASKWLTGYLWDRGSARYRSGATGRFVKRADIQDLLGLSIQKRANDIRAGTEAVIAGGIDPSVWLTRTATLLKREHLELAALAAGGWDRLDAHDYGRIGGRLAADYRYLAGMAQELADGTVTLAQALNRTDMYLGSARKEFLDIERENDQERLEPGEQLYARRHLSPEAMHCAECPEYADMGWTPADELPIPGESCSCGSNCRCVIEYRASTTTQEMAEGGPGSGNWGHAGIPGQRGGSAPKSGAGAAMSLKTGKTAAVRQSAAKRLDTADGLRKSMDAGVASNKLLNDTHLFQTYFTDYNDGTRAVVKPEAANPWGANRQNPASEVAAYEMDRLFGLDMVPATILTEVNGKPGSAQRFVRNATTALESSIKPDVAEIAKLKFFDELIGNGDRHEGNYMIQQDRTRALVAIDHGDAFNNLYAPTAAKAGENLALEIGWTKNKGERFVRNERVGAGKTTWQDDSIREYGTNLGSFANRVARVREPQLRNALKRSGMTDATIQKVVDSHKAFVDGYHSMAQRIARDEINPSLSVFY